MTQYTKEFREQAILLSDEIGVKKAAEQLCKLLNQLCADFSGKLRVSNKVDFSKDNYTVDVQRPFAFLAVARIVNAEACLIVIFDGINFVSFLCTVKINLVVFFAVKMRKGKSVRVSVIAQQ